MKKAVLLFILSLFATMLFAGIAHSADTSTTTYYLNQQERAAYQQNSGVAADITNTLGDVLDAIGGILKKVFGLVTDDPFTWMKVLFFIAIYAILYAVLNMKTMKGVLDSKTAGILGFVISFATVAIMPKEWLFLIANMYGGLVVTLILVIPLIYGVAKTRDAIVETPKAGWVERVIIILGWLLYIIIVETAITTMKTSSLGMVIPGPAQWVRGFIYLAAVVLTIWLIATGFSEEKGTSAKKSKTGKPGWFSRTFGFKGGAATDDLSMAIVDAEELETHLKNAITQVTAKDTIKYHRILCQAETTATRLINDQIPNIEHAVKELTNLDATKPEIRDANKNLVFIRGSANNILTTTPGLKALLTPAGGYGAIDWGKIATETDAIKQIATETKTKIEAIETLYDAKKAAYAAAHP